jgi:hypothetical protein
LPPLEAWEKVFVGGEFLVSVHNVQNCIGCHGGVEGATDMEAAHEGVVRNPLVDSDRVCGICHVDTTQHAATSLHQNLTGYHTALTARGADFDDPHMLEAFDNHCDSCHTTCGQCHISRPTEMGSGLLKEHEVKETASMKDTCMACHGARVSNEYQGKNEGVEGSVHWLEGGMPCFECHEVSHYHGDGTEYAHRYDGAPGVDCLECHPGVAPGQSEITEHNVHADKLACEVCHVSGPYKSCYNCHVAMDDQGLPYYKSDDSKLTFEIGRNPIQSEDRPWDYVLVRHVPVAPDTFAFYGDDLLPDFDNSPTWKYATPHNIQRVTAQNESCDSCHGNDELFLTVDDVDPEELEANADVIVEDVPPAPHPGLENYTIPQACVNCHPKAVENDWEPVSDSAHSLDWEVEPIGEVILCEDCHSPQGNFDWAAAGYSDEEAAGFIWSEYPAIEPTSPPPPGLGTFGVLGISILVVGVAAVPLALVLRRNDK